MDVTDLRLQLWIEGIEPLRLLQFRDGLIVLALEQHEAPRVPEASFG
jgi:hypothetical protein